MQFYTFISSDSFYGTIIDCLIAKKIFQICGRIYYIFIISSQPREFRSPVIRLLVYSFIMLTDCQLTSLKVDIREP